jgi:hypothetical protein
VLEIYQRLDSSRSAFCLLDDGRLRARDCDVIEHFDANEGASARLAVGASSRASSVGNTQETAPEPGPSVFASSSRPIAPRGEEHCYLAPHHIRYEARMDMFPDAVIMRRTGQD